MPRRPRRDAPGRLHHALNRGQNRQRIFRYRRDYRFFLSLLARARRAGRIRIHAYCLMPNHFHLLVESLDGNLSETMRWIQSRYAAYFNRTGDNTGHAVGGRFHSFPVTSSAYAYTLIRYIDRNILEADRRKDPLEFAWGSATHHARPGPRPRWLSRVLIDQYLNSRLQGGAPRAEAYRAVFRIGASDPCGDDLVERRLSGRSRALDDLDTLLAAGPEEILDWLRERTRGPTAPTAPLAMVDAGSIRRAVDRARRTLPPPTLTRGRGTPRDPWPILETGLLRDLGGLTYTSAARLSGVGLSRAAERYAVHRALVQIDDAYGTLVSTAAHGALELGFGAEVRLAVRAVRVPGLPEAG